MINGDAHVTFLNGFDEAVHSAYVLLAKTAVKTHGPRSESVEV